MQTAIMRQGAILLVAIGLLFTTNLCAAEDHASDTSLKVTGTWGKVELEKPLWVEIRNLGKWAHSTANDTSKFVLCLNGIEFKGLAQPFLKGDLLAFQLRFTPEFKDTWKTFVGGLPFGQSDGKVEVTVRYEKKPLEGSADALITIDRFRLKMFAIAVVALTILFVWLAQKTDIIREPGPQPGGQESYLRPNRKPYSLGRGSNGLLVRGGPRFFRLHMDIEFGSVSYTVSSHLDRDQRRHRIRLRCRRFKQTRRSRELVANP